MLCVIITALETGKFVVVTLWIKTWRFTAVTTHAQITAGRNGKANIDVRQPDFPG